MSFVREETGHPFGMRRVLSLRDDEGASRRSVD